MLEWRAYQMVFFLLILLQGLVGYGLFHSVAPAPRSSPVASEVRVNPVLRIPVNPPNPFI